MGEIVEVCSCPAIYGVELRAGVGDVGAAEVCSAEVGTGHVFLSMTCLRCALYRSLQ